MNSETNLKELLAEARNEIARSMQGGIIPYEMGQEIRKRRQELIDKIDAALQYVVFAGDKEQHSEQWWRHEVDQAFIRGYDKGRESKSKSEWLGLSDRAKLHFVRMYSSVSVLDFIDAIEIELREKNT